MSHTMLRLLAILTLLAVITHGRARSPNAPPGADLAGGHLGEASLPRWVDSRFYRDGQPATRYDKGRQEVHENE